MHVTDPIADMLTRLRNAGQAGLRYTTIPASRLKIEIAKILESEGLVRGFRLLRDGGQGKIKIALKFEESGDPVIKGIERVSKPSKRVYARSDSMTKRHGRFGILVLSTPKGVMTDKQAQSERVGGEVLAYIW